MKPSVVRTALAAALAISLLAPSAISAQPRLQIQSEPVPRLDRVSASATEQLTVPLHRAHLLALPNPVRDVIVPNPEIVDTIVKTPTEVYLVAKQVGETNLFFVGGSVNPGGGMPMVVLCGQNVARKVAEFDGRVSEPELPVPARAATG